jgi:rhodanese-related sulfurtransferase
MWRVIQIHEIIGKMKSFLQSDFGTPVPDKMTFVEIGSFDNYLNGHLPKAIYLRTDDTDQNIRNLFPNSAKEIILYTENENQSKLDGVASHLNSIGYPEVYVYSAGKREWISEGQALEYSLVPADRFREMSHL